MTKPQTHPLEELVSVSRELGSNPNLVLHGGGNTSAKGTTTNIFGEEQAVLWVKGSGWDLATIQEEGFPALDLEKLRSLRNRPEMSDEEMVSALRICMLNPSGPSPSVETLLHAFLPHQFVLHSHANAVLALTNRGNGEELCREVFGNRVVQLPFVMPGFPLAKAVAETVESNPSAVGVVLRHHGLFTFSESAKEALQLHQELVGLAEQQYSNVPPTECSFEEPDPDLLLELRGAVSAKGSFLFEIRNHPNLLAALSNEGAEELLVTPPLTPDHSLRIKNLPCWVEGNPKQAVQKYTLEYQAYFERGCKAHGEKVSLDPYPRVFLVPGVGLIGVGKTTKEAAIAADLAEHNVLTKVNSKSLGAYCGLGELELFEMEYWSLEQAKLGKKKEKPLTGKIAAITGGAGAIGEGVAEELLKEGACVALLDLDADALQETHSRLVQKFGTDKCMTLVSDVCSKESLEQAMSKIILHYGGLDIFIPNAGVAAVGEIADLEESTWRRLVEINQTGAFLSTQIAAKTLQKQGVGGSIILISSKNVPAPGAAFAAYSSSKAGAHQLARVAALELASHNIRVNMICPDAIFHHGERSSGLWETVGPDRAKAKGFSEEELESHYQNRNLLQTQVTATDVGRAVVFFATQQTPTTGAWLPVDGGLPEAFPR